MNNKENWLNIGKCLYHISFGNKEAYNLWNKKSRDCDNYEAGSCAKEWKKMDINNVTNKNIENISIETIHFLAKNDNPIEYFKIFNEKDKNKIKEFYN